MIINQAALNGIYVGFNTMFNRVFTETKPLYEKVATKVTSNTGEQSYKWLGMMPAMKEWIGEREIQNLSAYDYTIKNKDYEGTIGIDRNDVEDDTLGLYSPAVSSLAESAARHPDNLVFDLMTKGFEYSCYDGKPFYSSEHKVGKSKNKYSNKGTKALSLDSYIIARSTIMSFLDEFDKSLNLVPDLLVVSPANEGMARKILLAEEINGSTNVYKDTAALLVIPELAKAPKQWHLLCTSKAIKPFIFQERKPPKFVALTNDTDMNVFLKKQYLYGVDGRSNVGYGFWQMAYGSTGEEA
jgi:phage major head subunit gpT-like protein